MKNRRDICAASEAGFIEFEGLPGAIKTGCQLTPGYQSRYCYHHAPRVSSVQDNKDGICSEGIVKVVTAEKKTRSGIYYQVKITQH